MGKRRDKWDGATESVELVSCFEQKCGFGGRMGYWYRLLIEEQTITTWRFLWRVPLSRYRFVVERFFVDWEYLDSGEWMSCKHLAEEFGREYLNGFECSLSEIEEPPTA